ncbi:MFS transporter [Herpetosiphon gulosus]|uniref:Major facilitator superfamily (MFS) profile domain-containing protein n=1 Tax=Herpetosiphon gulosus TaxID=1973496 RepID=A0ABP9X535_9CHLR
MSQSMVHEANPATKQAWKPTLLIALLAGQFIAFGLVLGVQGVILAEVMLALALTEGIFGTVQLALPVVGFLVLMFNSKLYLRLGNKWQSILSLLLLVSAMLAFATIGNLWGLILGLILSGAGFAMLDAATNSASMDFEQASGRHILNVMHGLSSGGVMLGAFITGFALESGWSYQAVAIASAAICCSPIILATFPARYPTAGQAQTESADPADGSFHKKPLFIALASICFLGSASEAIAVVWTVIYLLGLEASIALSGTVFALFNGAMLLGRFINAPIVARLGSRVSLLISGIGMLIAAALLLLFNTIPVSIVAFIILGLAVAGIQPTALSAAAPLSPNNSGAVAAPIMMSAYGALLIAPLIYGWIAEFTALRPAMLLVGLFGLITCWLTISIVGRHTAST